MSKFLTIRIKVNSTDEAEVYAYNFLRQIAYAGEPEMAKILDASCQTPGRVEVPSGADLYGPFDGGVEFTFEEDANKPLPHKVEVREYTYKREVLNEEGKIIRRPGEVYLQEKDEHGYWRDKKCLTGSAQPRILNGLAICRNCKKQVRIKAGVIQNHTYKRRGANLVRCSNSGAVSLNNVDAETGRIE